MSISGEIFIPEFVRDVDPILMGAAIPGDKESLAYIVESPLVPACQDLFEKNVRTVVSSANANDMHTGFAYITLDCSTMSDDNRCTVIDMGLQTSSLDLPGGGELLLGLLRLPVDYDTRVRNLSRKALEATAIFSLQPKLW